MSPVAPEDGVLTANDTGLALAKELIGHVHEHAATLSIRVSAAVVDRGGNLVAVERMDGTPLCGTPIAIDKAYSAVACASPTDEWSTSTIPGGPDWGMASALGGRMVVYPGGIPISLRGSVIGGLGVSGGEGDQDKACAQFALSMSRLAEDPRP
ncbi:MAG: heme-binding protein [Cryobacterium sp.]|nr:heme-binding protein [Cryobacterium sp.]